MTNPVVVAVALVALERYAKCYGDLYRDTNVTNIVASLRRHLKDNPGSIAIVHQLAVRMLEVVNDPGLMQAIVKGETTDEMSKVRS